MHQEHAPGRRAYDPGRAGDVALDTCAREAVGVGAYELSHVIDPKMILRMAGEVGFQEGQQRTAMHPAARVTHR